MSDRLTGGLTGYLEGETVKERKRVLKAQETARLKRKRKMEAERSRGKGLSEKKKKYLRGRLRREEEERSNIDYVNRAYNEAQRVLGKK